MSKRLLIVIAVLATVAAACTVTTAPSTSEPGPTTSTQPTTSGPTTTRGQRVVSEVDCDSVPEALEIVCQAYDLIQTHYVDPVADEALAEAAIEGLRGLDGADTDDPLVCVLVSNAFAGTCQVAAEQADSDEEAAEAIVEGFTAFALDANSAYFDAQELELLAEEQQGEIEGIGALVRPADETIEDENQLCSVLSTTCKITIISVIPGAPAEEAGLARGDEIVGVDGESVLGWSVDQLTATVRGPAGTDVTITIDRAGERFDVTITRAAVQIPILETDVFGSTGYIKLQLFTANAGERFEFAVIGMLGQGIDTLVVDLRNNPGGLLNAAIHVTSVFLGSGDVIVTQGPDTSTSYPVLGGAVVPVDMRVIFVVNEGSASASEVVSGVLQERGRATVVGENTFGKNTVQQRFSLTNGGAIKLTIARWLTPGGLDFGGIGITPDIEMVFDPDITSEDLVAAVLGG